MSEPLELTTARAYAALRQNAHVLPTPLAERFDRMIEHDWLRQYGNYAGQAHVFQRFGQRLSRPELLTGVMDTLQQHEQVLAKAFDNFYPRLQRQCAAYIAALPDDDREQQELL